MGYRRLYLIRIIQDVSKIVMGSSLNGEADSKGQISSYSFEVCGSREDSTDELRDVKDEGLDSTVEGLPWLNLLYSWGSLRL
jgi:hypothetical protein